MSVSMNSVGNYSAHGLNNGRTNKSCLLYTSPSPRDRTRSRMPSSAWKKTKHTLRFVQLPFDHPDATNI